MVSATSSAPAARPQRFVDRAEAGGDLAGTLWQPAMSLYLVQQQHVQTLLSHGNRFLRQFEEDASDRQQAADERQNGASLLEITTHQVTQRVLRRRARDRKVQARQRSGARSSGGSLVAPAGSAPAIM